MNILRIDMGIIRGLQHIANVFVFTKGWSHPIRFVNSLFSGKLSEDLINPFTQTKSLVESREAEALFLPEQNEKKPEVLNFSTVLSSSAISNTQMAGGSIGKARSFFERANKLMGEATELRSAGQALEEKGDFAEALKKYKEAKDKSQEVVEILKENALEAKENDDAFFSGDISRCREKLINQVRENFETEITLVLSQRKGTEPPTFLESREIWGQVANVATRKCFTADGNIDIGKARVLMAALSDPNTFGREPFFKIPSFEFVRSQIFIVLEHLTQPKSALATVLKDANGITPGEHGQAFLDTMSSNAGRKLKPAEAILMSLFSPHRQARLPTCTINSRINVEIRNNPERLAKMYKEILAKDSFNMPGGYFVRQRSMENGRITVDLKNGKDGKKSVFRAINSGDEKKISGIKAAWQEDGIQYDDSKKYQLGIPIRDLNDVFFANFFEEIFGNPRKDFSSDYGTTVMFTGYGSMSIWSSIKDDFIDFFNRIKVSKSLFVDGINKLKECAEAQPKGMHYMRVSTGSHAENINVDKLRNLNLKAMEDGEVYCIGDRNWVKNGEVIPLAIRKTISNGTSSYEFGTVWTEGEAPNCKIFFRREDIQYFLIYSTEIKPSN